MRHSKMTKPAVIFQEHRTLILFLMGMLLGSVVFLIFYGGWILVPTHDAWVVSTDGDMTQHQLGWLFYRKTPWRFPIGLIEGISSDGPVSCMYTDSIPVFAIFFKLLSPILPEHFQYMGLWGISCYALQGGFSMLILYSFRRSVIFSALGSIFYITFPGMIDRFYHHDALMAQWLILWGILLCVKQDKKWKHRSAPVILWTLNTVSAVLIHAYYIPMVYMIMLAYIFIDVFKYKKKLRAAAVFISSTVFSVITMWVIGGFYGKGSVSDGGLGTCSANLNSLFNSFNHSPILKPLPVNQGQSEGLGYLGAGMLLLAFTAFISASLKLFASPTPLKSLKSTCARYRNEIAAYSIVFLLSLFAAASPVCTFGHHTIYSIEYPQVIWELLSIYRCSGRFIWVAGELFMTAAFYLLSKQDAKRIASILIALCLIVQSYDLHLWIKHKKKRLERGSVCVEQLRDKRWDTLFSEADEIVFAPLPRDFVVYRKLYFVFAEAALKYDLPISSFSMARTDYETLRDYADDKLSELYNGTAGDELFVFFRKEDVPEKSSDYEIFAMDGYYAARKRK